MTASKNKQEKFLELFNPLKNNLWKYCLSICRNNEDAKELLAETIYQAYLNFDSVKDKQYFLSFLFTIASRTFYKSKKSNLIFEDLANYENVSNTILNPEEILEVKDLYDALNKLPIEQKEAIVLFDIMGFSRKEISEIQNTSLENVKARLFRGRKKLSVLLKFELEINNDHDNDQNTLQRSTQ